MASVAPRELKIGKIIDKTFGVIEISAGPALVVVAILTAINIATTYFSLETSVTQQALLGLAKFVAGLVTGYVLLEIMIRKTGLRSRTQADVFFAYCALSVLYTLGFLLGFILFVFPAFFIMARWSIAAPMLIARGEGPMKSLGESWELTRGNEFSILAAILALFVLPIAITIACAMAFDPADLVGIAVAQLAAGVMSLLSIATGVALYGMIVGGPDAGATVY